MCVAKLANCQYIFYRCQMSHYLFILFFLFILKVNGPACESLITYWLSNLVYFELQDTSFNPPQILRGHASQGINAHQHVFMAHSSDIKSNVPSTKRGEQKKNHLKWRRKKKMFCLSLALYTSYFERGLNASIIALITPSALHSKPHFCLIGTKKKTKKRLSPGLLDMYYNHHALQT